MTRKVCAPQGPPSDVQRAVALCTMLGVLPVAVVAEAWDRHRDDIALGVAFAGYLAFAGCWRVAEKIAKR